MSDREYAKPSALPNWLKSFADNELQKEGNPFDDIREMFKLRNDGEAVEARVEELRKRVGLDNIEKTAKDQIPGGNADNQPDSRYDKDQLGKGIKVEMEHTTDKDLSKEIAKDHLEESKDFKNGNGGKYYDKLEDSEKEIEKETKKASANIRRIAKKINGYSGPLEEQTLKNKYFRKVLFTGEHSQLVLMSVKANEDLGIEVHKFVDQFFRIEAGEAIFVLNGKKKRIKAGGALIIPSGTEHNVINASDTEPLKLYTIYSPPNHPPGTIHKTKEDAEKAEKNAQKIVRLVAFSKSLINEGMLKEADIINEQIKSLQMAKDKEVKKLPEKFKKYEGLDEFIQNACRTSGGFASLPAIQDRLRKEFNDELDVKNKDLESYIKYCLKSNKEDLGEEYDNHAGEYITIIVTEDDDGNSKVFDECSKN